MLGDVGISWQYPCFQGPFAVASTVRLCSERYHTVPVGGISYAEWPQTASVGLMIETPTSLIFRIRDPSDSRSWREFVSLYGPLIRSLLRHFNVPRDDIEDVCQEVFAKVIRALPTFEWEPKRGRFSTWLWKVVYNAATDYFRRKNREAKVQQGYEQKVAEEDLPPDESWLQECRQHVLKYALEKVRAESNPTVWYCFEQYFLKGRPAHEIACEMGIERNTVYVYASRTLDRIRAKCLEYMESLEDEQ